MVSLRGTSICMDVSGVGISGSEDILARFTGTIIEALKWSR